MVVPVFFLSSLFRHCMSPIVAPVYHTIVSSGVPCVGSVPSDVYQQWWSFDVFISVRVWLRYCCIMSTPVLCRVCFASCYWQWWSFDVFTHVGYYCCVMSTMHRVCFANCLLAMVAMGCI